MRQTAYFQKTSRTLSELKRLLCLAWKAGKSKRARAFLNCWWYWIKTTQINKVVQMPRFIADIQRCVGNVQHDHNILHCTKRPMCTLMMNLSRKKKNMAILRFQFDFLVHITDCYRRRRTRFNCNMEDVRWSKHGSQPKRTSAALTK